MTTAVSRKPIVRILSIILTAALIISVAAPASFAATKSGKSRGFVQIQYNKPPVKAGNYYYKYSRSGKIVRSLKKSSGYKTVIKPEEAIGSQAFTNGKQIYYIHYSFDEKTDKEYFWLARCTAAGKNLKLLKKIPSTRHAFGVSTIYKGNVYITGYYFGGLGTTYRYCIKTGKLTREAKKAGIIERNGKYVLTAKYFPSEPGAYCISLQKITSSGKLKKIKDFGWSDGTFIGDYVYYIKYYGKGYYDEPKDSTVKVYRCKYNGKKNEYLNTFKLKGHGVACSYNFTSKSCYVYLWDAVYQVFFNTGKVKTIQSNY